MQIGLGLPTRVASATGDLMLEWVTRADRGPFSSVVVTDRVVSTALEPLSVLAMAAGATSESAPSLRPHDRVRYYAAFIIDADGNRIEAVTFPQE